jgi:signal transduction histidine kinase
MVAAADLAAGIAFLLVGILGWRRSRRQSALFLLAGIAWFVGPLVPVVQLMHRPLMLHAALAYPRGRLPDRRSLVLVIIAWALSVVPSLASQLVIMIGLGLLVALAAWWRRPTALPSAPVSRWMLSCLAAALALPPVVRAVGPVIEGRAYALLLYGGLIVAVAVLPLVDLLRRPPEWETDAVIELSGATPGETLVSLRSEAAERPEGPTRTSLLAAVALLESNLDLQRELAARVAEVRDSRRQLVQAAAGERRALGRALADGPLIELAALETTVVAMRAAADEQVQPAVTGCLTEIAHIRGDLSQLGRGLHPRVLTDRGLAGALAELAAASPVPVMLSAPSQRYPETVETEMWYACAEVVTNALKYADARSIRLEVESQPGLLQATITDDGRGGATLRPGGGLAGLADRLSALGGGLRLESAPIGTTVRLGVARP